LVVTQSGSDPAARHGSGPRTDAILYARIRI